ncbi:MAG: hypothetical protein R3204_01665 [Oceanospirillum sp.]|nr:hypothetical protein [Oceanospirillum sp.]MDX1397215.1 hypothetical protein [Oceanospirillum sp.]
MAKSLKPGRLCKLDKSDISKHFRELTQVTRTSNFLCGKCARSASDKKRLCRPMEM